MVGEVTKELAANEYSCDVQDICTLPTHTDGTMHEGEDESSSGRLISELNDNLLQSKHLNTNNISSSSSINANHEDDNNLDQITTKEYVPTAQKLHVCDHCGKQFKHKGHLNRHVRTHTGERPYSCDHCEYKCARKGDITLHIRTHTGEKPFSCTVCGKFFAESGNLKQHQLTHTGDKLYGCEVCGKMFKHSSGRIKHAKQCSSATNMYICTP